MEFFHAETYEDALREVQRLKENADDPDRIYKIVKSPYDGFDIVAVASDLYVDLMSTHLVDGLPTIRQLGNLRPTDHAE